MTSSLFESHLSLFLPCAQHNHLVLLLPSRRSERRATAKSITLQAMLARALPRTPRERRATAKSIPPLAMLVLSMPRTPRERHSKAKRLRQSRRQLLLVFKYIVVKYNRHPIACIFKKGKDFCFILNIKAQIFALIFNATCDLIC